MTATTQTKPRFRLIGTRVSQLIVDEKLALAGGIGEVRFEVTAAVEEPQLSDYKFSDRKVIELSSTIKARVVTGKEEAESYCLTLRCTAGFVGFDQRLDGNIDEFLSHREFYSRGVYWVTRSRLESAVSVTLLRSFGSLPWDLEDFELNSKSVITKKPKRMSSSKSRESRHT